MKKILTDIIKEEAKKSAEKYQLYHNYLDINIKRKNERLTTNIVKNVKVPDEWNHNPKHNPFFVFKHAEKYAYIISKKIRSRNYQPEAPFIKQIPKKSGGTRTISIYQLPDSAVSDKFYKDLLKKNKHRFSSFSYAYRNDRNVHFAIQDISNEINQSARIFIAEFDFSDFFGSISHDYIKAQLKENCFLISSTEQHIIDGFLAGQTVGVPLGTSISLFLANLACWPLDRKLEDEGLRFARYADDTIIWTRDYSKICKAFEIINEFSKQTGIKINYDKSDGISLLQKSKMRSEFANPKTHIDFLGYRITVDNIGIRDSSVKKIKKQISYLLYKNLIEPLKSRPVTAARLPTPTADPDFLSTVAEIRRYLYGNLTETTLKKYLNGTYVKLSFKGIMSFYPLVNDEKQMQMLDKWLISTILNALRKRKALLELLGYPVDYFPFTLTAETIIDVCKNTRNSIFQIPSFLRIYRALERGINDMGIDKVMNPDSRYYEGW